LVFDLPVADTIFLLCTLVAGVLLLITVLVDDILGGIFEFLDLDIGGSSLMPLLLAFVAMFGIGGLFGTQVLELSGSQASVIGIISGFIGAAIAWLLFRFLRQSTTPPPFSPDDLVGETAYVAVAIPRTQWGTITLEAEGQTHEFRATSSVDIERGQIVDITGVAGNGLIVTPHATAEEGKGKAGPAPDSDDAASGAEAASD
jgi:membrane protein implicated in regulation of membrane protease activity